MNNLNIHPSRLKIIFSRWRNTITGQRNLCPVKSHFWLVKIIILLGKKFTYPYVWFSTVQRKNVHVFFKQKDKVCDSQVRICLSLLLLQVRIWLFFSRESACVTVKMTSEWSFWLVNFKVTISSQTLSLNQLLHVFWPLTLKCLLSHMMLIQIPWPTQEVITSHIHRQLHNLGRGRRSFKPYPKRALFSQTSQSKMQKITLDVDLKMALLPLE